jgi:hypothetical protein
MIYRGKYGADQGYSRSDRSNAAAARKQYDQ